MKRGRLWVLLAGAAVAIPTLLLSLSSPSMASPNGGTQTIAVNAFGIGAKADDLIPARGTTPGVVSVGDVSILNDQLTSTHKQNGGYPIIGYDSGTCTYTRVAPDGQGAGSPFNHTYELCTATAVMAKGSITAEGVVEISSGVPKPATLAISGGTGAYWGETGTVKLSFGRDFNTYTFNLR
jgi:Allene oxide cyclase barrel like domain